MFNQRLGRFDRPFHDAAQGDPLTAKLDPAGGDAGDFQQVIDEMLQLCHLALDDAAGLPLDRILVFLQTKHVHGVGQRGERIA